MWHTHPMVAFDLETTGTDPETARIVTAAIVHIDPCDGRNGVHTRTWLANPGIDIPAEATAVHGVTTEHATTNGDPAAQVVHEIAETLHAAWADDTPVVIYNAVYDLTVLDRELRRHHNVTLDTVGPVVDPFVLDKTVDRYRKGSRTLGNVCAHYGIDLGDDAHTAGADALAAARLAWALANRFDDLADVFELQHLQARSFAESAASLEDYLRRRKTADGEDQDVIDALHIPRHWPLIPHTPVEEVA